VGSEGPYQQNAGQVTTAGGQRTSEATHLALSVGTSIHGYLSSKTAQAHAVLSCYEQHKWYWRCVIRLQ
jgi:hypothetical protein